MESGIKQILKETESYYVLAWKPLAVESGKPKFNMLKVSIKGQPGLRVLARKGFYSAAPPPLADNKPAPKETKSAALKPSEAELRAAVTSAFPRRQLGLASYTNYSNETADTYKIMTFRLPYGSEIPLSAFAPGRYTLKVTANDRSAKTSASQYLNFTIE